MQVNASLQNQNLRTDLRWVAKRIRKSARKFTQVAKSRKFHVYTVDLRSICIDLHWVAKQWKTCVDLRTNLSSTKADASGWPNETQVERKSKTCEAYWPGFKQPSEASHGTYHVQLLVLLRDFRLNNLNVVQNGVVYNNSTGFAACNKLQNNFLLKKGLSFRGLWTWNLFY